MTDKIFENDTPVEDVEEKDELTLLKERADLMGIKYHPSIGLATLKEKVNSALSADEDTSTEGETPEQRRARLVADATRLIRVRVTCMDPNRKGWPGEIFTVSNGVVGTVRKYVPFNAENGYHVPNIILKHLKRKKRQEFRAVKTRNGMTIKKGYLVPAFAIEELPPLTPEELKELARRQALNHSID
jgi:hypothetical protein